MEAPYAVKLIYETIRARSFILLVIVLPIKTESKGFRGGERIYYLVVNDRMADGVL